MGGTINWTAPELHEDGHPSSTLESDIWSLGCLFYEVTSRFFNTDILICLATILPQVLASRAPFSQYRTSDELVSAIVKRREIPLRPEGRHQIDDHIWKLMIRCWSSSPRDRPSCEEVWHFIIDLGTRDTRPPIPSQRGSDVAVWEGIRATWDSKIDYQRVYDVLAKVNH